MRSESPCWIAWASDVMKSSLLSILEIILNKTLLPDLDESVVVFLESILLIRSKWGSSKPPEIKKHILRLFLVKVEGKRCPPWPRLACDPLLARWAANANPDSLLHLSAML